MSTKFASYITLVLACLALCGAPISHAEVGPLSENQVKAAYLFNFAKFVDWPASAFVGPGSPLVIGFLGKGPSAEAHEAAATTNAPASSANPVTRRTPSRCIIVAPQSLETADERR